YPFLILMSLVGSWRLFFILTLPVALFVPGALFFATTFKAPLNETFWIVLMGTNVVEASDYITANAITPFLIALLVLIYWAYCFYKISTPIFTRWQWRALCGLLIIIPIVHYFKGPTPLAEMNHHFTESYPLNMVMSYQSAQAELKNYADISIVGEDKIKILKTNEAPENLVLVIGESARRDRLQLFGASTPNNPEMEKILNELVVFSNAITLHPHTVASIPVMLTKQKGLKEATANIPSFVQILKKAGYKTFWISNQSSLGGGGSNRIGYYARSTDFHHFFHIHDSNNPTALDEEVLNTFKEQIKDPAPKKFFVLHLQGSHYGFEKRYPSSFAKFPDPYDNTLLYTDYILGEVVRILKNDKRDAGMMYLSDHGLLLNACGNKFTHFDNKESFEIPFFVWASGSHKDALMKAAAVNRDKPLTTEFVFDSLMDMAGVSYEGYNKKLSVFSPEADPGERLVQTYSKIINYDTGKNDEDCHMN
ncbi:MAG: phosphoethanolamine transferase, partial [Bdellovibrio sp.]|nr:phosphoethanolamine transferase [Bdellovibrio sp.]